MSKDLYWKRAIILADMNAFFASIEQQDQPQYQRRPIAITNGWQGSCIITSSYEAREFGVKTGMRLRDARKLCPELIQCPSRPERYAQVSSIIMTALQDITPDIEVFSVDEAFLDVTQLQRYIGSPEAIARQIKDLILDVSGILCSVGISGDKTTAKFAAKLNRPDGLTIIHPDDAEKQLMNRPVTDLCGIASGIERFLAQYGVTHCGDMKQIPISILANRFGNPGRRLWYMCQGKDPEPLQTEIPDPKSIGHGKVLPPRTQNHQTLQTYLQHMSEKVAARLRRHHFLAKHFYIGLKTEYDWIHSKPRLATATQDGQIIMKLCNDMLASRWRGQPVNQVQVTALDLQPERGQLSLFNEYLPMTKQTDRVMDSVNQRYGEFVLAPARMLGRSKMPNVIAPAWKPFGHRQTIDQKQPGKK